MQNFRGGLVATAALLVASGISANANTYTYDFTYTFSDAPNCCAAPSPYTGYEIVGSFTGTPSGSDVIDISNVSAELLNPSKVLVVPPAALTVWYYTPTPPNGGGSSDFVLGNAGAVASKDGLANNFLFANSSTFGAWTEYFYVIQPWYNNGPGSFTIAAQFVSPGFGTIDPYNGQYFPNYFTLTQTPLPSTWTMLLLGFAGFGFFVYRGAKKNSAALAAA